MKKYLIVFLMTVITCTANAGWHIYPNDGCAILPWVFPVHWGRDDYYFCGAHKTVCNNDNATDDEVKNSTSWYKHKDSVTLDNARYWCCGGKITSKPSKFGTASGTPGKWVKGPDFMLTSTAVTKTKKVGGGVCTYTEMKDICGEVHTTEEDCKDAAKVAEMVTCPDGQYFRQSSKSCASYCQSGYAYESPKVNTCIECPETLFQGIVSDELGSSVPQTMEYVDPEHQVCRKCNPATSFFNPRTRTCVLKTDLQVLSISDLQYGKNERTKGSTSVSDQCWTKFGSDYEKCVLGIK